MCEKINPPTATDKKLTTNGGNLGTMMKLNEGKYKVTRFARDIKKTWKNCTVGIVKWGNFTIFLVFLKY